MGDVEGGQDAPAPVDLGIVLVDLGDDQEYAPEEDGEGEAGYEWIGLEVKVQEALVGLEDGQEPRGQLIELGEVRVDCLGPVDAVRERLQDGEHHSVQLRRGACGSLESLVSDREDLLGSSCYCETRIEILYHFLIHVLSLNSNNECLDMRHD